MSSANWLILGQLQKMGILAPKQQSKATPGSTKRRSAQVDFGTLAPLKQGGTVGFSTFRDNGPTIKKPSNPKKPSNGDVGANAMLEDSEEDDEDDAGVKMEDVDDKDIKTHLSPEDARFQGELAEGVGRIKVRGSCSFNIFLLNFSSQLKRQHSAEPLNANSRKSPASVGTDSHGATPPPTEPAATAPTLSSSVFGASLPDDSVVGSPLKKHRASLYDMDNETMQKRLAGFSSMGDVVAAAEAAHQPLPAPAMEEDEL